MQHTIVILTILLPEVFRRKWAQKWPIFDETPLYRKSFNFAEYARVAGPGRVADSVFRAHPQQPPALRAGLSGGSPWVDKTRHITRLENSFAAVSKPIFAPKYAFSAFVKL